MKWDPDVACVQLEKWTEVKAAITFTRKSMHSSVLKMLGIKMPLKDENPIVSICELSVLTNEGRKEFYGWTFHGAFLQARKALRPPAKKRKVEKKRRRPGVEK